MIFKRVISQFTLGLTSAVGFVCCLQAQERSRSQSASSLLALSCANHSITGCLTTASVEATNELPQRETPTVF